MNTNFSAFRFMFPKAVAVLLALFCTGCQLFGGSSAQKDRDRLQASLEEFSKLPGEQITDQPYLKGRVLVVTRKPDMPFLTMDQEPLPYPDDERAKELLAQTPEQVGTVVVLNYSKEKVGTYKIVEGSGGVNAYREVCELIVIDRSIPAVIHRKTFRGRDPASTTSIRETQGEILTSVDITELRSYIMKLPSK